MSIPLPTVPPDEFTVPILSPHTEAPRLSTESEQERRKQGGNWWVRRRSLGWFGRHTLGIILLLVTVFLWTASNFLASTIFADDTYSKPYFVTYINSSFFIIFLIFAGARRLWQSGGSVRAAVRERQPSLFYAPIVDHEEQGLAKPNEEEADEEDAQMLEHSSRSQLLVDDHSAGEEDTYKTHSTQRLNVRETMWLSFEFFMLWFLANYFIAACLEYTTVGSSTILSSTSSIFTLFIGAWLSVEKFTFRKLIGVLASLAGIVMISSMDLTGNNDKNRGSFPHKSHLQLAIGDAMALISALLYGIYTSLMKKRIADESRVDMMLFFGFVGLFNMIILLPGFPILHFTGIETFEIPPTKRITAIVLVNSATSLVADFCWAYSMLLTSPLVTTVGLSLSIPLSLFGEIIINHQTSGAIYWLGACVVLLSFVFINYESTDGDDNHKHDGKQKSASDLERHDDGGNYNGIWGHFRQTWDGFRERWRS